MHLVVHRLRDTQPKAGPVLLLTRVGVPPRNLNWLPQYLSWLSQYLKWLTRTLALPTRYLMRLFW